MASRCLKLSSVEPVRARSVTVRDARTSALDARAGQLHHERSESGRSKRDAEQAVPQRGASAGASATGVGSPEGAGRCHGGGREGGHRSAGIGATVATGEDGVCRAVSVAAARPVPLLLELAAWPAGHPDRRLKGSNPNGRHMTGEFLYLVKLYLDEYRHSQHL